MLPTPRRQKRCYGYIYRYCTDVKACNNQCYDIALGIFRFNMFKWLGTNRSGVLKSPMMLHVLYMLYVHLYMTESAVYMHMKFTIFGIYMFHIHHNIHLTHSDSWINCGQKIDTCTCTYISEYDLYGTFRHIYIF